MQELAAGCGKGCAGLVLGLGILLAHTSEAAEFTATSRISMATGETVGNEVVSASPPAISQHHLVCNDPNQDPMQPYFAGTADTVAGNGTGSMMTDTFTCRGPLPIAAQSFQTMKWFWDDVVISGPPGSVPVTLNLIYRYQQSGFSYVETLRSFTSGANIVLPDTGGVWTSTSHPLTLVANTPNELRVGHKLDVQAHPHYTAQAMDFEVSLANIVFDLPPATRLTSPRQALWTMSL